MYTRALALVKEPAALKTLQDTRDALAKKRDLQALNDERAPIVSKEITQQRIVRPRLAALPPRYSLGDEVQKGAAE